MIRRPPRSPLFPSTTLSRSEPALGADEDGERRREPARRLGDRRAAPRLVAEDEAPRGGPACQEPLERLGVAHRRDREAPGLLDRKSTRLNSSHPVISYAGLC